MVQEPNKPSKPQHRSRRGRLDTHVSHIEDIRGELRESNNKHERCLLLKFTDKMQHGLKTDVKEGFEWSSLYSYISHWLQTVTDVLLYYGLHRYMAGLTFKQKSQYVHTCRWFDQVQHFPGLRPFSLPVIVFHKTPNLLQTHHTDEHKYYVPYNYSYFP